MADRLTELQNAINQQAENLCNAVGILQQSAQPSYFVGFERSTLIQPPPSGQPDLASNYAKQIRATAQQIDYLITSLPERDVDAKVYLKAMETLDRDYRQEAEHLREKLQTYEKALHIVKNVLSDIAETQLKAQANEAAVYMSFLNS